jgi:hypothetical protein
MSGLGMLLQVAVVIPVCQMILTSGRFPKPKNILYAIAFLVAVACASQFASEGESTARMHMQRSMA